MKANYKIVASKQKMLEKEIENFEPTSTMSVLLMRYSIMRGMLQVKLNGKDENGIPDISPSDMACDLTAFFGDAVDAATENFMEGDEDNRTVKFDGTIDEFRQELTHRVMTTLSVAFEHEFVDFLEKTGVTRAQFEVLAAQYIAHTEENGGKVSEIFEGDNAKKLRAKEKNHGWTSTKPKRKKS